MWEETACIPVLLELMRAENRVLLVPILKLLHDSQVYICACVCGVRHVCFNRKTQPRISHTLHHAKCAETGLRSPGRTCGAVAVA
eukprot:1881792-Rhodomonas_salina.2